jgi:hypothetical protein
MAKFGSITLLLAVGTATLFGQAPAAVKGKQADYYPLRVGNKWHYQLDVNGKAINMVGHIAKTETVNGVSMARFEGSVDGKTVTATEHLSSSDKGVFRHRYNGQEMDPPLTLMKYPIKEGETWTTQTKVSGQELKIETTVGKWEEVEVPAGKFKAIPVLIVTKEAGNTISAKYWFAANVGVVMQDMDVAGLKINMKLAKFEGMSPGR